MEKKIVFERDEDVRMTYRYTMSESDWEEFKEYTMDGDPEAAAVLKDLTYEDAVKDITNEDPDYVSIKWDKTIGNWQYSVYLTEAISDYCRDIAIDDGPYDEHYYDDGGDETLTVEED